MLPSERFCRRCGAESLDARLAALRRQQTRDEWVADGDTERPGRSWLTAVAVGALTIAAAAIGFAIVNFENARAAQDRADETQARAKAADVRAAEFNVALRDTETKLAVTRVALDDANKDQTALAAGGRQCLDDLSAALNAIVDLGDSPDADSAVSQARTSCSQFDSAYTALVAASAQ